MVCKVTYAGAHCTTSYQEAQKNLEILAEFSISTSHIQRLTTRVAKEFDQKDNSSSDLLEELPEPQEQDKRIEVASISVDGGRTQIREEDCGPGVHNPRWIEPKVGCLQILRSTQQGADPHPVLPRIFQDKKAVKHMVEGLKGKGKQLREESKDQKATRKDLELDTANKLEKDASYAPKVLKRFTVADISNSEPFGHLLYRRMYQHNLHTAPRKAYVADGDPKLWTIYEENFRADGWTPILDFIHAVEYAHEAAKLSTQTQEQCWARYIDYVTHIWQGRPLTVIRRLDKIISELENHGKSRSKHLTDKIDRLKTIRGYFQNNFNKMDYPEYRKKGLPVSSCHVESLIKQFNIRIKSSDKFWNQSSVKGIIKIKASLLSDDESWTDFWDNRYDHQLRSKMTCNRQLRLAA